MIPAAPSSPCSRTREQSWALTSHAILVAAADIIMKRQNRRTTRTFFFFAKPTPPSVDWLSVIAGDSRHRDHHRRRPIDPKNGSLEKNPQVSQENAFILSSYFSFRGEHGESSSSPPPPIPVHFIFYNVSHYILQQGEKFPLHNLEACLQSPIIMFKMPRSSKSL